MKTVITPEELFEADLRPYNEIWLASIQALAESGHSEDQLCLWRSNIVPSHEMLSEGSHGQNVSSVWLALDNIDDADQVLDMEELVRGRLESLGLKGEFYPAERGDTHSSVA
jgi:hypothetical protein